MKTDSPRRQRLAMIRLSSGRRIPCTLEVISKAADHTPRVQRVIDAAEAQIAVCGSPDNLARAVVVHGESRRFNARPRRYYH